MNNFEKVRGGFALLSDGNRIPRVGLGISRNRGQESLDNSVRAALSSGYRLFDTAHIYENEHELGEALEKNLPQLGLKREDVFITTKVPLFDENSVENARRVLEESFAKLRTNYIDLVLIHYPRDRFTGRDDYPKNPEVRKVTWQLLEEYHTAGRIRSLGISNYEIRHIHELLEYAKVIDQEIQTLQVRPVLNQCEYHPYFTQNELRAELDKQKIFFQAILYAFALNTNVGIIPKSATPSRIEDNIKAADIKFTPEEVAKLLALNRNLAFCPGCSPANVV